MAGHVNNLATKYEDPTRIHSWVMSYNVSHYLPLKMRMRPLRMRRITWPVSRGWKTITFFGTRPRFAYSLYNFYWATTTIKGRLLLSVTNAKALVCVNFLCVTSDHLTLNSCLAWRVTWPAMPPSLKILRLFVHELWVITVPTDYHWKCVRGHCACAESRDPWIGGSKTITYLESPTPICLSTFIGLRRRLRVVYSWASPMLKPLTA